MQLSRLCSQQYIAATVAPIDTVWKLSPYFRCPSGDQKEFLPLRAEGSARLSILVGKSVCRFSQKFYRSFLHAEEK